MESIFNIKLICSVHLLLNSNTDFGVNMLTWDLDSTILMGSFQFEILYDCMIISTLLAYSHIVRSRAVLLHENRFVPRICKWWSASLSLSQKHLRGLILLWFCSKVSPFEIAKLNRAHSYMPQKSLPYSIRGRKQIKGTTNHITRRQSLLCRFTSSGHLLYFKNEGQS